MDGADMCIGGAATAAEDVDESFFDEGTEVGGKELGRFLILAELVGKAGVWVGADEEG